VPGDSSPGTVDQYGNAALVVPCTITSRSTPKLKPSPALRSCLWLTPPTEYVRKLEEYNSKIAPQRRTTQLDMKSSAVLNSIAKMHLEKDVENLNDSEFEIWVDDYIKRNITQRVEFGLEQVLDTISYNLSISDLEPRVDDLWN